MDGFSDPITWSRNFDDEELDEEDYQMPEVKFEWTETGKKLSAGGKVKTKLLLVGVKTAASVFVHATFEAKEHVGSVLIENLSSSVVELRQHHLNHKSNKLYLAKSGQKENGEQEDVLIFVSQVSSTETLNQIVKALFASVEAEETVIFDTIPASTYLAGIRHEVPTIRRISTSAVQATGPEYPTFLEPPALIEGVTAALLQYLQIRREKASAYISLQNDLYLESPTIVAWEPCLKLHTTLPASTTSYAALLKKVVTNRPNSLFA